MADPAELFKWWDALDALGVTARGGTIERGLQLARESRHPDAKWLASLFPAGDAVTAQRMAEVMLEQGGDDPRAVYLAGVHLDDRAMRRRAAEMGYAPAQAQTAVDYGGDDMFAWAEKASAQGDRTGTLIWPGVCREEDARRTWRDQSNYTGKQPSSETRARKCDTQ
jgi:hypothetical protein